jgi:hypothetical protein|tara:strand:- start:65 stop:220 length:156 start_codon:yes stop_codon:yes gene_type:complete
VHKNIVNTFSFLSKSGFSPEDVIMDTHAVTIFFCLVPPAAGIDWIASRWLE